MTIVHNDAIHAKRAHAKCCAVADMSFLLHTRSSRFALVVFRFLTLTESKFMIYQLPGQRPLHMDRMNVSYCSLNLFEVSDCITTAQQNLACLP